MESASADTPPNVRRRRLGAIALLLVGAAVTSRVLGGSWPRDQGLTFRLPRDSLGRNQRLDVAFTPVSEREPAHGLSLQLVAPAQRDVQASVRLRDGEYIIALSLTYTDKSGPSAPEKTETSRPHRVTLAGQQTLVVFDAEGSE